MKDDMFDFGDGSGPVPARRHAYGGGWVARTATVHRSAFVEETAAVFGKARVYDHAVVLEDARVYGSAQVRDQAQLYAQVEVFDFAEVYENAHLSEGAKVCGNASVSGVAYVGGKAVVSDHAVVNGRTIVCDSARVGGAVRVRGYARILGFCELFGREIVGEVIENFSLVGVPVVAGLDRRMFQISLKEKGVRSAGSLYMGDWHACETAHCRAGWAIHFAGEEGYDLEEKYGPWLAGALIYVASTGRSEVPNFFADQRSALEDIRQCAFPEGSVGE